MITTEDEAKTKRCQESFAAASSLSMDGRMFNGGPYPMVADMAGAGSVIFTAPLNCIGYGCMAWRWTGEQQYEQGTPLPMHTTPADPEWLKDGEPYVVQSYPDRPSRFEQRWRRPLPRTGYCGKAGKP